MFTVIYKSLRSNNTYKFVAPCATRAEAIADFACFFNYDQQCKLVAVTQKLI